MKLRSTARIGEKLYVQSENLLKNFHLLYNYTLKWSKNHLHIKYIKIHLNTLVSGSLIMEVRISIKESK